MSYSVYCNNLPILTQHKTCMANISKQSIQSCTPLVNKQFAPGFHIDLMTR